MQLNVIKSLVEQYDIPTLEAAEAALTDGLPLAINVPGADEGEQLTHILSAIAILTEMNEDGVDLKTALREFARRVRSSITPEVQ